MVIKIVIFLQHRLLGNWKSIFDRACDQKDVGLKIHVRLKVLAKSNFTKTKISLNQLDRQLEWPICGLQLFPILI